MKITQVELAKKLGVSYPRVNELIHKKRGVTPDKALRLEQLFGMEAQFWLNLQLAWDLYQVVHSPAEKEIRKIKLLPELARAVSDLSSLCDTREADKWGVSSIVAILANAIPRDRVVEAPNCTGSRIESGMTSKNQGYKVGFVYLVYALSPFCTKGFHPYLTGKGMQGINIPRAGLVGQPNRHGYFLDPLGDRDLKVSSLGRKG